MIFFYQLRNSILLDFFFLNHRIVEISLYKNPRVIHFCVLLRGIQLLFFVGWDVFINKVELWKNIIEISMFLMLIYLFGILKLFS